MPKPIHVIPQDWRVPRSFVSEPTRIRAVWRNLQWRTWQILIFLLFASAFFSLGIIEFYTGTPDIPSLASQPAQVEFLKQNVGFLDYILILVIPLILITIIFILSLYWIFGCARFTLDSRGVRYSFSVIIPLRIVRIPLETVDSFSIEWYSPPIFEL